jgi:hypothetical protein
MITGCSQGRYAEAMGCSVARVIVVLDRPEGAAAAFAARGPDFRAMVTIRDLGVEPHRTRSRRSRSRFHAFHVAGSHYAHLWRLGARLHIVQTWDARPDGSVLELVHLQEDFHALP